jgi:hypothetical protein
MRWSGQFAADGGQASSLRGLIAEDVRLVIETRRDMDKHRELEQLGYRVRQFFGRASG